PKSSKSTWPPTGRKPKVGKQPSNFAWSASWKPAHLFQIASVRPNGSQVEEHEDGSPKRRLKNGWNLRSDDSSAEGSTIEPLPNFSGCSVTCPSKAGGFHLLAWIGLRRCP